MPIVSMFYGIIIRLNVNEHNPPHIHAEYAGYRACFDIKTGKMTVGEMPERQTRFIQVWMDIHQEELLADWQIAQEHAEVFRIEPLK